MYGLSRLQRRKSSLDRNTEARFIAALKERNRDSAEGIRALMFTFEDLGKLDPSGIQTMLRSVNKQKLTIARKGASETLKADPGGEFRIMPAP